MARAHRETLKKRPQPAPIALADRKPRGPKVQPLIPLPPVTAFGPAMMALPNDAQRAFVIGIVIYGLSQIEAGRQAGYSAASPHALDVHSSRLAHDDRVQAAILEEGQRLMRTQGPRSIHTLVAIRDDKAATNKDRLTAAKELLDRSGFHAVTESHVSVEHSLSDAEKDRRILMLAAELGINQTEAQKLLIGPPDAKLIETAYQEAEFEEVLEPSAEEIAAAEKRKHENTLRNRRRAMSPDELAAHKAKVRQEKSERGKQRRAQAQQCEGIEDLLEGIDLTQGEPT